MVSAPRAAQAGGDHPLAHVLRQPQLESFKVAIEPLGEGVARRVRARERTARPGPHRAALAPDPVQLHLLSPPILLLDTVLMSLILPDGNQLSVREARHSSSWSSILAILHMKTNTTALIASGPGHAKSRHEVGGGAAVVVEVEPVPAPFACPRAKCIRWIPAHGHQYRLRTRYLLLQSPLAAVAPTPADSTATTTAPIR
jgi:hypothetical protein